MNKIIVVIVSILFLTGCEINTKNKVEENITEDDNEPIITIEKTDDVEFNEKGDQKISINDSVVNEDGKYIYIASFVNNLSEPIKVKKIVVDFYNSSDNIIFSINGVYDATFEPNEEKNIRFNDPSLEGAVKILKGIYY